MRIFKFAGFFVTTLLSVSTAAYAQSINLTTYYPSPFGEYQTLRLFPQGTAPFACDATTLGNFYYDSPDGIIKVCQDDVGGGHSWSAMGVWSYDDVSGYIYPRYASDLVGIGTSTPTTALEVAGEITTGEGTANSPSYTFAGDSDTGLWNPGSNQIGFSIDGSDAQWRMVDQNFRGTVAGDPMLHLAGDKSYPNFTFYQDQQIGMFRPISGELGFSTSGRERVRIDSAGRIGIGEIDPTAKLEVNAENLSGAVGLFIQENNSNGDIALAATQNVPTFTTTVRSAIFAIAAGADNYAYYDAGGSRNAFFSKTSINSGDPGGVELHVNGLVGIGTTTSTTPLAVAGMTNTPGGTIPLVINTSTGEIFHDASSKENKENIKPLDENFYKILEANPKTFNFKNGSTEEIGYIAEEFEEIGLKRLVSYDANGEILTIKYDRIGLYLVEVLKQQQEQIEKLEKHNQLLEARILELEQDKITITE